MTKTLQKCGTCRYWKPLTGHNDTWGLCQWPNFNPVPELPLSYEVNLVNQAFSPKQTGCLKWE